MPSLPASASSKSLLAALDSPNQLQEIFAGFSEHANSDTQDGPSLESRLLLSAKFGLALLSKQQSLVDETQRLQLKNNELETSLSQLLDRLASSYKENAQLIKRAERAQANLDASEASNRQLLITLEDDRKTIRRLASRAETVKPGHQRDIQEELEELRQELESERRRARAAETKAKRASSKLSNNESRLTSISQQLEKAQHARRGKSSIAASPMRARHQSDSLDSNTSFETQPDVEELVKLIEDLRSENEAMRGDMQQMNDLLDSSRDQLSSLRTEQADRAPFASLDDDHEASRTTGSETFSDNMRSPDLETVHSTSTAPTSTTGQPDWFSQEAGTIRPLPHNSFGQLPQPGPSKLNQRRRSQPRTASGSAALRRLGGRAMSVDLSNMMQRRLEDLEFDYSTRPVSPVLGSGRAPSPSLRPLALGTSVGSLSSSLGAGVMSPSLPTAHEDIQEIDESVAEGPTILEIAPSPAKPPHIGEGGLTASSPTHYRKGNLPLAAETREMATQTENYELPQPSPSFSQPSSSGPPRPRLPQHYTSSILSSDAASDHETLESFGALHNHSMLPSDIVRGNRTIALGALIEYVMRLLTKIKGADINSFEQRLKKQNLPGDVSHLAKSTMRDILGEIEGLRNHFRQVLEQETAALQSESGLSQADLSSESLLARRDFVTLVKLFRDILHELGRLRAIVNRVELEPQLANKLRELENMPSTSDLLGTTPTSQSERSTGAAALLAPLSRLFYGQTDASTSQNKQSQPKARPQLGPTRSSSRPVPKLGASSALAAATVNVEFGGQGGIRRQVSVMPQGGDRGLAGAYQNSIGRSASGNGAGVRSGGSRNQLSSIFAGGSGAVSPSEASWVVLPGGRKGAPPSRQTRASSYRQQVLTQNVDAVIDNTAANLDEDDFRPNLLERTLRPRGLSDSSIHSTFMSHANPASRLLTPAGLALSSTSGSKADQATSPAYQADGTIRATLATNTRPSILGVRKLSENIVKTVSTLDGPSPSPSPTVEEPPPSISPRRPARSPRKSSAPVTIGGPSSSSPQRHLLPDPSALGTSPLSRSPGPASSTATGSGGLLANLGAWASRGGLQSPSYQERTENGDGWMGPRSVSASYLGRKPTMRDGAI